MRVGAGQVVTIVASLTLAIGGCAAVLGIDSDRHVVEGDAGAEAGAWFCRGEPEPDAGTGNVKLEMLVNDVSSASSGNNFDGNPVPAATIVACSTLDFSCNKPVTTSTSDDAGIAFLTLPAGFNGYYQVTAAGFTPAVAYHTPQFHDEFVYQGLANVDLITSAAPLVGVTIDSSRATAIVSAIDCTETPAAGMTFTIGMPDPKNEESLIYLQNSLPSSSAKQTDGTGSAIVYNVPPGTFTVTANFASDGSVLRSVSTLARMGWVTFVLIRLDQSTPGAPPATAN